VGGWKSSLPLALLGLVAIGAVPAIQDERERVAPIGVDFPTDVLPVFTKIGCNAGGCHGAALGQNDFKLSLLGYDARADWQAITRELKGRRVDRADPSKSLVLLKPSGKLEHGGGCVLPADSEGHKIVKAWLEAGAPWRTSTLELERIAVTPGEQIRVTARFSDGTTRDVTRWALYASNDDAVAEVTKDGRVTLKAPGETAIVVRYGGHVAVARALRPFGTVEVDFERPGRSSTKSSRRSSARSASASASPAPRRRFSGARCSISPALFPRPTRSATSRRTPTAGRSSIGSSDGRNSRRTGPTASRSSSPRRSRSPSGCGPNSGRTRRGTRSLGRS
jgi:hypothetical protein